MKNSDTSTIRVWGIVFLAIVISGCGSQALMTGQQQMGNSFEAGNFNKAAHIADSLRKNEVYKAKDRVLFTLERGTIHFFQNNHEKSVQSLTDAEDYIDQFFAKSTKRGIKAFLTNDTQLAYNGEVYEDVYLNGFKSLSYLKMDDFEASLVEARRIASKLDQAEAKYGGLADSLGKADTTESSVKWNAGTSSIHDSPWSHYLASALYAKSGAPDDARIEMEKMKKAIENHQALPNSPLQFNSDFKKVRKPQTYNTMLTAFSGSAPKKIANNIDVEGVGDDAGLKIAIPKLVMDTSNVEQIKVTVNDTMTIELPMLEEMDKVAQETFKIKKPIIVARATVRGILKTAAQDAATEAAEEEGGELLGDAVGLIAGAARKASEKADLRGWQTMPGKVYSNVTQLPAGKHRLSFEYYSADGKLLSTEERSVQITENERLEPVASIYSN